MIILHNLSGQLGNRLMRLNNALQLSKEKQLNIRNIGKDKVLNEIDEYFDFNLTPYENKPGQDLNITDMGDLFFTNKYDPRNFLKIKDKYQINLDNTKTNIGIHIRYEPIKWQHFNDETTLKNYYLSAIKYCVENIQNPHFIIFGANSPNQFRVHTDKAETTAFLSKFKFYQEMLNYFKQNNISYDLSITIKNPNQIYLKDFIQMTNCDVLISSHSTFCITAGFIGKHKKIIHANHVLDFFKNDKFWKEIRVGGNQYYKLWKSF